MLKSYYLLFRTGKKVKAQREDFSKEDIRQINLKYKCSGLILTKYLKIILFD